VGLAIHVAPPPLPVYVQTICPGPNYILTPGYWAYDDVDGYYWVTGAWVLAPEVGLLWTPGYWGWGDGVYLWHAGYWGPHVGFYGGINYGFGYTGVGYSGGYWDHGAFRYNTAVSRVNVSVIHNTYNRPISRGATAGRVSFNGGRGGVNARPTAAEESVASERHVQATSAQVQHQQASGKDRSQFASVNHGRPAATATAKPGATARSAAPNRNGASAPHNAPAARFNAKPASSPRGNFERPAETPRANPAPRESAPARAAEPRAEQPSRPAPARAEQPHAAPQPREQAHAAEAQPRGGGGAPAGNQRHDGK
jgi:WXXGXW repeat (2 copies)